MTPLRIGWGLFACILLASLITLALVPEGLKLPVHWGIDGQPDRYGSAMEALLMPPAVTLLVLGILSALKWLEPRRKHLQQSLAARNWIALSVVLLMLLLEVGYIALVLGYDVTMVRLVIVGVSLTFVIIGNFLSKTRSNFFIGIRTPWTLSSDEVWRKTHRLGARLFILAGLVNLPLAFVLSETRLIYCFLLTLLPATLVPVVYSWWLWRQALGTTPDVE